MTLAGVGAGLFCGLLWSLSGSPARTVWEFAGGILLSGLGVGAICAIVGPRRAARFIEFLGKVL